MDRGRGGRGDFSGFRGDPFGGLGGFGGHGNLVSSIFGGRDPFDDPFFTEPFGGMMGPNMFGPGRGFMGPSLFGPMFIQDTGLFGHASNPGFLQQQAPQPQPNRSKGPIIKELNSDDEEEGEGDGPEEEKNVNPRKHLRPKKEVYIEEPDEENEEKKSKHMQYHNDFNRVGTSQPQARTYSFQSSTVTYGGLNGAYYTSSTTRRTGGDGVTVEESKEADTTTGKASHRLSRGIHDKGHSVVRKLNSDGRVDTTQTLHNLNEDELPVFEEAWKGDFVKKNLPGWNPELNRLDPGSNRPSGSRPEEGGRGWALPSTEQQSQSQGRRPPNSSFGRRARSFDGRSQ